MEYCTKVLSIVSGRDEANTAFSCHVSRGLSVQVFPEKQKLAFLLCLCCYDKVVTAFNLYSTRLIEYFHASLAYV